MPVINAYHFYAAAGAFGRDRQNGAVAAEHKQNVEPVEPIASA